MASSFMPAVLENVPISVQVVVLGAILAVGAWIYRTLDGTKPLPGFPMVDLSEKGMGPKEAWSKAAPAVVAKGLAQHSGPFQVMAGTGPKIVVPNRFAEEFKSDSRLDFSGAISQDFFIHYPGFEPMSSTNDPYLVAKLVRVKLTQSLGLVTESLVDEATNAVHDLYGEETEWKSIPMKQCSVRLVTRLSSRVFLGKPLCRDERWLTIARDYTVNAMMATRTMRQQNPLIRPFAHYFAKPNQLLVKQVKEANTLISAEVEKRKLSAQKAIAAGKKVPKTQDSIGWMVEMAQGWECDYTNTQLTLTMAAIHTTSEALSSAIMDICQHPEIVEPLRQEIVSVLSAEPWSKTALYKMKLMDSFLKESQRVHAPNVVSMLRKLREPFTLSDGTVLPKGSRAVVAGAFNDPSVYEQPEKFDAYRFFKLRNASGNASDSYQHVTTSGDHIAFGHGAHACPGRFFASNELKVALAHLLLKYDITEDKSRPLASFRMEGQFILDPMAKVMIRRRKEEIQVDLDHVPE